MDLFKVLDELKEYSKKDREEQLVYYINKRLNDSLSSYYDELDKSRQQIEALESYSKVLKKLNTVTRF